MRARAAGSVRGSTWLRVWGPALVVAMLVVGYAWWIGDLEPAPLKRVVWVAEKTTSAPAVVPDRLRHRLSELVSAGPVALTTFAVGRIAYRTGTTNLHTAADGQPEFDERLRADGLDRHLAEVTGSIERALVGLSGFSLQAALGAIETEASAVSGPLEVWLSTTVLTGSVEPLSMSALAAADPQPMVDELVNGALSKIDLGQVELHPILLTPVGAGQQPLTPASDAWRSSFIHALASGLGANVDRPSHELPTAAPWDRSSATSPVAPLYDPPYVLTRSEQSPVHVFDTVAFVPDEATLIDHEATLAKVETIARQYRPGMRVTVAGYCAAYGDAENARALSARRAEVIGELLLGKGIPADVLTTGGRGFDERANVSESPRSAAQRVVLVRLHMHG